MTAKILSIATISAVGIIIADLVIHPRGTAVILSGLSNLTRTAGNQMLGYKA